MDKMNKTCKTESECAGSQCTNSNATGNCANNSGKASMIEDDHDMMDCASPQKQGGAPTEKKMETMTIKTAFAEPYATMEYSPDLKLSRASFMQLLYCYTQRLENQKPQPGNKWQEYAYPRLLKMFTDMRDNIVGTVCEMCNNPAYDKEVVMINFCGYKNFKLPLVVNIQRNKKVEVHPRATYERANVVPVYKTLAQRMTYLSTVSVPQRYNGDEKKTNTFKKVQEVAKMFLEKYVNSMLECWQKLCKESAEYAGIPYEERSEMNHRQDHGNYHMRRGGFNGHNTSHGKHAGHGGYSGHSGYDGYRGRGGRGNQNRHGDRDEYAEQGDGMMNENTGSHVQVKRRYQGNQRPSYRGKYATNRKD